MHNSELYTATTTTTAAKRTASYCCSTERGNERTKEQSTERAREQSLPYINIMSWEAASTVKLTTKLLTIWSNFVVGVNE